MGSIYKRGMTYWVKYRKNGKPYRESSRSDIKQVARALLQKREGEIVEGKMPGVTFDRVTFDELAEEFLNDYRVNQRKSLYRAEVSIGHLMGMFKGVRVVNITSPKIQEYVTKRLKWECSDCQSKFHCNSSGTCPECGSKQFLKGAAVATVNRELAALKRLLNLGAQQTPPKVAHIPHIHMLKENNARKGFFEYRDFLALRDALPAYLKPFVTFGYKSGWRISEITGLTWDNVDIKNGVATLNPGATKNDEARTLYLDDELLGVFKELWDKRLKQKNMVPYIFTNCAGNGPIVNIKKAWNNACLKASLGYGYKASDTYVEQWVKKLSAGPTFHDLRRTAVRNMIRAGVPERVAMALSGHKTRSVFDRYNIVSDSDLKSAARKQQEYLESQVGTVLGTVPQR